MRFRVELGLFPCGYRIHNINDHLDCVTRTNNRLAVLKGRGEGKGAGLSLQHRDRAASLEFRVEKRSRSGSCAGIVLSLSPSPLFFYYTLHAP